GKAIKEMNKSIKVDAKKEKVAPPTEHIFHDEFFESLDFVVNALDNIEARKYMDGRCAYYKKPLIESGTQGPKGNVQIIIPYKTEHYGIAYQNENEPMACTVHHYVSILPNIYE